MTRQNFPALSRWSPAVALLLASLAFKPVAQAQDLADGSTAANTSAVFTVEKTPNSSHANDLFGISGDSENDIWAVGTIANGALGLHFDGSKWTAVPMALPFTAEMRGVSVLSPDDVWAVGSAFNSNPQHETSVIQHFDGKKWNLVSSPQFSSGSQLFAVKAISSSDVFAVGETHSDSQKPAPLVEHFDGTKWSVVHTPQFKGQTVSLQAIAAISGTDLWVTGSSFGGPAVIMHFDGQKFRNVPFPMANKAFLGGLSAIATDDVWVVGTLVDRTVNATKILTLTAHWDGKAWTIVPSPNPPTEAPLAVVAAISSNDVWAAGGQRGDAGVGQTFLIEHWNGKHWTINPVPLIGKGDDEFSIVAFPSGNVYVAGLSFGPSPKLATQTLILHTTQGN